MFFYDKVKKSTICKVIFKFPSWYGFSVENNDRLLNASIFALFTHLFFFGCLVILTREINVGSQVPIEQRAIQIDRIDQAQLDKYRRVGVRGGTKGFNMRSKRGNTVSKGKNNSPTNLPPQEGVKGAKGQKNLSMDQLQAKVDPKRVEKVPAKNTPMRQASPSLEEKPLTPQQEKILIKKEIIAAEHGVPLTALRSSQAMNNFRRQKEIQFGMLRDMGQQSTQAEILKTTGFNLHFEPPDGIPEDELNSVEKIFYSFQKRTFIGYVNSFMSSYQDTLNRHPQVKNALRSERHLLTGRVTFDKEGNIVRIKILRSSQNDDVHRLFEDTLRNIRSLPNPPKAIIEDKDQFNIYYQLKIN